MSDGSSDIVPIRFRGTRLATAAEIDRGCDGVDDATQVYGDGLTFDIHNQTEPCDESPVGQCQYSHHDGFRRCIHCDRESEL